MSLWNMFHKYFPFLSGHVVTGFKRLPSVHQGILKRILARFHDSSEQVNQNTGFEEHQTPPRGEDCHFIDFLLWRMVTTQMFHQLYFPDQMKETLVTIVFLTLHAVDSKGNLDVCPCSTVTATQAALVDTKDTAGHHCLSTCTPAHQSCRADGRALWQILSFLPLQDYYKTTSCSFIKEFSV